MMMLTFMILCILLILLMILNYTSKKTFSDMEKNSPFECGFDPKTNPRVPFSLQFFLIAIIFLIFDIEIALIMPFIKLINYSKIVDMIFSTTMILLILILGLYHEWSQGALKWLD